MTNSPGSEDTEMEARPTPAETGERQAYQDVPTETSLEAPVDVTDEELSRQLAAEVDELTVRVQESVPAYEPPPFSPKGLVALLEELLARYPKEVQIKVLEQVRSVLSQDLFDPELWKGAWFMLNYTLRYNVGLVRRRFTGEYDTDKWGLDWEFVDLLLPLLSFLYKSYWRVETTGLENVPVQGRALLVANHSGQLPWDGMMIGTAILT